MHSLLDIKNMKKNIAIVFIIFGIFIITYPKMSNVYNKKSQNEMIKKYSENVKAEQNLEEEVFKARSYNKNFINKSNDKINYEEILNINKDGVMGYIEIPKIDIHLLIYHGTDEKTLKKGVGHLKESSVPIGEKNSHVVLTGHSGLKRMELFTKLPELEIGDFFYLHILNRKLKYKVYKKEKVLPSEVESLQIEEDKDLVSLVTCVPYGINTHRLLVHGEKVEESEQIEEPKETAKKSYKRNIFYVIIVSIIILCCILLKKIVKYIQKVRKKQ